MADRYVHSDNSKHEDGPTTKTSTETQILNLVPRSPETWYCETVEVQEYGRQQIIMRTALKFFVMLCAAMAASVALAGHYSVQFSGGHVTVSDAGTSSSPPFSFNTPITSPWRYTYSGAGTANVYGDVLVSSDPIVATFTWQPDNVDDVRPDAVVIKVESSATWSGDSGTCNNGFGDPLVSGTGTASSSGTHYLTINAPASSFALTCSPNATAHSAKISGSSLRSAQTLSIGGGGQGGGTVIPNPCSASVNLAFTPFNLNLDVKGTEGANPTILIGQKFSSAFNVGGLPDAPGDTFTWIAPGGAPFASYSASSTETSAPLQNASVTAFVLPSTSSRTLACTFSKAAGTTISCTFSSPSRGISVSLSRQVQVKNPSIFFHPVAIGTFQLGVLVRSHPRAFTPDVNSPDDFVLTGAIYPQLNALAGIWSEVWVETPPGYLDVGKFCVAQLVTDATTATDTSAGTIYVQPERSKSLDLQFPYFNSYDAALHQSGASARWLPWSDQPGFPGVRGIATSVVTLTFNASYELYLLYKPGASDVGLSEWVPLPTGLLKWQAKGTAHRGNPWTQQDDGSNMGSVTDATAHPTWNTVIGH